MITIQSTDVNSYVKSLIEKIMNDHFERDEPSDNASFRENESLNPKESKKSKRVQ